VPASENGRGHGHEGGMKKISIQPDVRTPRSPARGGSGKRSRSTPVLSRKESTVEDIIQKEQGRRQERAKAQEQSAKEEFNQKRTEIRRKVQERHESLSKLKSSLQLTSSAPKSPSKAPRQGRSERKVAGHRSQSTHAVEMRPIAAIAVASPPITRAVTMPLVHPSVPPPFPLRIPTPPATVKPYPMHVF
jgi:hypothetical protein